MSIVVVCITVCLMAIIFIIFPRNAYQSGIYRAATIRISIWCINETVIYDGLNILKRIISSPEAHVLHTANCYEGFFCSVRFILSFVNGAITTTCRHIWSRLCNLIFVKLDLLFLPEFLGILKRILQIFGRCSSVTSCLLFFTMMVMRWCFMTDLIFADVYSTNTHWISTDVWLKIFVSKKFGRDSY